MLSVHKQSNDPQVSTQLGRTTSRIVTRHPYREFLLQDKNHLSPLHANIRITQQNTMSLMQFNTRHQQLQQQKWRTKEGNGGGNRWRHSHKSRLE